MGGPALLDPTSRFGEANVKSLLAAGKHAGASAVMPTRLAEMGSASSDLRLSSYCTTVVD